MTVQVTSFNPEADKAVNAAPAAETAASADTTSPAPDSGETHVPAETETASGAVESEEAETTEESEQSEASEASGKKVGGIDKRINKLTAKRKEAERERDYWRAEALKSAQGAQQKPKDEAKPAEVKTESGKPVPDSFATHAEYVEALTDWKVEQKEKEREAKAQRANAETEFQKLNREYGERAKSFSEKTEDFHDVLEEVSDVPLSPAVRDLFLTAENGPQLAYELAKNKAEFVRVNKLAPLAAAREIGKLEAKLSRPSSETKETKTTTKAPKPINPVNGAGGSGAINRSLHEIAANGSQSEYEQARAKQRAAKTG